MDAAYVETNPDLATFDEAAARLHWSTYGVDEGRTAARAFHVGDYLRDNPDLRRAFGDRNYRAAIRHWLVFGAHEGRHGASGAPKAKQVGIMYSVMHGPASSAQRYRAALGHEPLTVADVVQRRAAGVDIGVRELLDVDGLRGHAGDFVYLNRPSDGFYSLYRRRPGESPYNFGGLTLLDSADTRGVARHHADQLVGAGIDFVYVDVTNLSFFQPFADTIQLRPLEVLFEEWAAYRAEGHATPAIAVFASLPAAAGRSDLRLWPRYLSLYNRTDYDALVARDPSSGKKLFFVVDSSAVSPEQKVDPGERELVRSNGGRGDVLVVPTWAGQDQTSLSQGAADFFSPCRIGSALGFPTSSISADVACNQAYTPISATLGSFVAASAAYQLNYAGRFAGSSSTLGGLTLKRLFDRAFAMHPDYR